MSHPENDKLWDKILDAVESGDIHMEDIEGMDLEDAFDFLMKNERKDEKNS